MQQCFDPTASELGINKLLASSTHVIDIDNWDFTGASHDTLGSGLLPFSMVPPDAPSKGGWKALQEDQERSRMCDMSGDASSGAMSSSDAKKLHNNKGHIPTEWTEASVQIEAHAIVLGTMPGSKHTATVHCMDAFKLCECAKIRLHAAMNKKFGVETAPAPLVLHFQLNLRSWFQKGGSPTFAIDQRPSSRMT